MTPVPGMVVAGSFELLRPLDGEAGRVWLARDKALLRNIALKFQKSGARGRAALLAEAAILSRCDHPSIVQFYRAVTSVEEPVFFAMKAYPSARSSALTRHSSVVTRHCAEAVASALAYLHALSPPVAHGDVKWESILFDGDGRAVLAGFGKARPCVGEDAAMADDVRGLGLLLSDAWNGRPPRALRPLLARMLAEDPAARPSAAEVVAELSRTTRSRWHRIAAAGAVAVALAAAVLALVARLPSERPSPPVIDEVHSPSVTAAHSLHPRLPGFTPEAIRRIPWDYFTTIYFDAAKPGVSNFLSRYQAFQGAHPDRLQFGPPIYPGTLRLIRLPGDVQLEMAAVPAGLFRRGFFRTAASHRRAEFEIGPDSVLVSKPFWMARTELTRAQYAAVTRFAPAVAGHPAHRLRRGEGRNGRPLEIEGGDLPVGEDLDFADVQRFIDQLNALCGLEGDRRFRLPTEAEWELACRALVAKPFEGEGNPGDVAWTRENSGGAPHPVAQKAMNPLGLFDLHGNFAEWCSDAYGPLPDWAPFGPCAAPASNDAPRVVRGGSFRDAAAACDSDARASALPTDKGHAIRLVAWP